MGMSFQSIQEDHKIDSEYYAQRAHERAMNRKLRAIERNPNAYNRWESASVRSQYQGLSEREREMADRKENMQKLINAGMEGAAAAQGQNAAKLNAEAGIKKAELELAQRNNEFRTQNGYFDESGVYHVGTGGLESEKARQSELEKIKLEQAGKLEQITQQGQNAVNLQTEANKAVMAQENAKREKAQEEMANKIKLQLLKNQGNMDTKRLDNATKTAIAIATSQDPEGALKVFREQNAGNPEAIADAENALNALKGGQQQTQQQQTQQEENVPGYSAERVRQLRERGYTWTGSVWIKREKK